MTIKNDIKSVLIELSPILAGFKLAVILIGYFGLGSVAKWVISYWYPFTRWVWDKVAEILSLPEFAILVKDSLTALVFFLPLGITAIWQFAKGRTDSNVSHRVMGSIFGVLFLIVICKDVVTSILKSVSFTLEKITSVLSNNLDFTFAVFITVGVLCSFLLLVLLKRAERASEVEEPTLYRINQISENFDELIEENRSKLLGFNILVMLLAGIGLCWFLISRAKADEAPVIIIAVSILAIILLSLILAILYAPKKLYITTGAATAFVVAAVLFELFIAAKVFMENVNV